MPIPEPSPNSETPGSAEAPTLKTSALAIWGLVLGIASIITCGLTSIPGLIVSIIGLVKIGDPENQITGRGKAIAGIVMSASMLVIGPIIAISSAVALPTFVKVTEKAEILKSTSNMRTIMLSMRVYALDYEGAFPKTMEALKDQAGLPEEIFLSPLGDGTQPYVLLRSDASDAMPPDTPVIRDPNVVDGQTIVGFADGSIKTMDIAKAPPLP